MGKQKTAGESDVNPRSCIVTRERFDREKLIRFVKGPDDLVVPDLKGNLPGRGVWVEARKSKVQAAVEKQLFARSLKSEAKADGNLPELIEKLLNDRALQALALSKKAGLLVSGFSKVDTAIRSNSVVLLVHASNAAEDGKRKLAAAANSVQHLGGDAVKTVECWTVEEMSAVLGIGNATHVAALRGGASRQLGVAIEKLEYYRD